MNNKDLYVPWKKGRLREIELPEVNDGIQCEICLKGKRTAAPTPKKSERKSDLLEIIHTDVCGPMRWERRDILLLLLTTHLGSVRLDS